MRDATLTSWQPPADFVRVAIALNTGFLIAIFLLEVHQPEAISIKLGNLLLVAAGAGVVLLTALWRADGLVPEMRVAMHDWIYLGYLCWCFGGVFWSVAPAQTMVLSIYLLAVWLAIVSLAFVPTLETVRVIFFLAFVVSVLSLVILPIAPEYAKQPDVPTGHFELRGVIDHQLRLGMMLSLSIGLAAIAVLNGRIDALRGAVPVSLFVLAILLCLGVLFLSRARATGAAFVIACLLCGLLARQRPIALASLAALATVFLALLLFGDTIAAYVFQNERDATLSGRTLLWPKVIELTERRWFAGYGYGSFYQPVFEDFWRNYRPPSAHSSWMQAAFETGVPGLALTVMLSLSLILSGVWISVALRRISYTLFAGLFVTLSGLLDVTLAGKLNVPVALMLLVAAQEATEFRAWHADRGRAPA